MTFSMVTCSVYLIGMDWADHLCDFLWLWVSLFYSIKSKAFLWQKQTSKNLMKSQGCRDTRLRERRWTPIWSLSSFQKTLPPNNSSWERLTLTSERHGTRILPSDEKPLQIAPDTCPVNLWQLGKVQNGIMASNARHLQCSISVRSMQHGTDI